jgi:hypothetical protein
MEIKREVTTVQVDYSCKSCLKGMMSYKIPTFIDGLNPPKTKTHVCVNCGAVEELDKVYPFIQYEVAEV